MLSLIHKIVNHLADILVSMNVISERMHRFWRVRRSHSDTVRQTNKMEQDLLYIVSYIC